MEIAAACLHQLSILAFAALLAAEFFLCNEQMQPDHVRLVARLDFAFLGVAVLVFFSGAARMVVGAGGVWVHLAQPAFWIKLLLFFAIGFLSMYPTLQFLRWNRALALGQERVMGRGDIMRTRRVIGIELALLALLPVCAVLMARAGAPFR